MIKEIIYEYWENELPKALPRNYSDDKSDLINDIIGIRRCGKTYLMFGIIKGLLSAKASKKSTIYVNFENRKLFQAKSSCFNEIIEIIYAESLLNKGKVHLFLDEVQRIDGWEKSIRSIYDEFKGKIKIYVSGSSANLLSREYGMLLTGRHLTTTVMPLSFKEFLEFKGYKIKEGVFTEKQSSEIRKLLEEYLKYGGFPEVALSENKEQILNQLFLDILSKDIWARAVRKENALEELAHYLSNNISSLLSFNKMANCLKSRGIKISVQTLENYFWLIKNAFLFFDVTIFSYKIKDQMQNPRKIYCIDPGIIGAGAGKNLGKMHENAVFLGLKRKLLGFPKTKIHYWKNLQHEEVDFVIKENGKISQLVQACYDISDPETKKREAKALFKASKELKCNNLLIITDNYEAKERLNKKTVMYIPLWKWLLEVN